MRFLGWLRGNDDHPESARSRVTIPSVCQPSPDVLREIRAFDDKLDLHILPNGLVWLLYKSDVGERIDEGRKQLAHAKEDGLAPERSSMLMAAGFELLSEESFEHGSSAGHLILVAQQKLAASKREIEQEIARRVAESDGSADLTRGIQVVRNRIRADAVSDWKWAHRGKKSFAKVM